MGDLDKSVAQQGKVIPFRSRRRERRLLIVFLVLLAVVAVVALLLAGGGKNYDALRRAVSYREETRVQLESSGERIAKSYCGGLAVLDGAGLGIYDKSGALLNLTATPMETPALRTAGKYALSFDAGGKTLELYQSGKGVQLSLEAEGSVFDADVSEGGYMAYVCAGGNAKAMLHVYNSSFELSYTVYSATRHLTGCAVSSGGRYAAAVGLGQKDHVFDSTAIVYATNKKDPIAEVSLGNQLIYDIYFMDNKTLCAIGQSSAVFFDVSGRILGTYQYASLLDYDVCAGAVVLELGAAQGGSADVVTVGSAGQELGRISVTGAVYGISASGKYTAVLTDSGLFLYDKKLALWSQTQETAGASGLAMCEDGSVFLLAGQVAWRYLP